MTTARTCSLAVHLSMWLQRTAARPPDVFTANQNPSGHCHLQASEAGPAGGAGGSGSAQQRAKAVARSCPFVVVREGGGTARWPGEVTDDEVKELLGEFEEVGVAVVGAGCLWVLHLYSVLQVGAAGVHLAWLWLQPWRRCWCGATGEYSGEHTNTGRSSNARLVSWLQAGYRGKIGITRITNSAVFKHKCLAVPHRQCGDKIQFIT